VRAWTVFDYASNSALSLVAVCRYVLRISLSRLCPCFSFRPQCRDVSMWRLRFLRPCCVEWFSRRLVLRLFPLPCHVVCHIFVWTRAALDQTGYASNSALSVFLFANVFCGSIYFLAPGIWEARDCCHFFASYYQHNIGWGDGGMGVGWGGVGSDNNVIGTSTHTWCNITVRSLALHSYPHIRHAMLL